MWARSLRSTTVPLHWPTLNDMTLSSYKEPWTAIINSRCLTKTHPAYDTFSPVDAWSNTSTRPRVMTYVRRDSGSVADQKRPFPSRDVLWLTVNNTTIVNFYRQNDETDALDALIQWPIPDRCLVAGDFNAKHHTWQTGRSVDRGNDIASWASDNNLSLLNSIDVPTNPHGNTIDLAFTNIPLAEANVEDHLATSSDGGVLLETFDMVAGLNTSICPIACRDAMGCHGLLGSAFFASDTTLA